MKKFRNMFAATAAIAVMLVAAPVVSAFGQISGGNIYKVRNVTAGGSFTDPANASCNDTVQFRVHIHNPGPDSLVNTKVQATLPSGNVTDFTSTVTVRADNSQPETTSDTATANLSASAAVTYVAGTTQLLDINGALVSNLPDGVAQGGVVLPSNVNVSGDNSRFVQFQVRVNCPVTPAVTTPVTPVAKPVTPAAKPAVLPNTGVGDVLGIFAGASAAGAAGHYVIARRRG